MTKLERVGANIVAGLMCYLPCPFIIYLVAAFGFDNTDPSAWGGDGRAWTIFLGAGFLGVYILTCEVNAMRKTVADAIIEGLLGDDK